jgi:hypothetical protein
MTTPAKIGSAGRSLDIAVHIVVTLTSPSSDGDRLRRFRLSFQCRIRRSGAVRDRGMPQIRRDMMPAKAVAIHARRVVGRHA